MLARPVSASPFHGASPLSPGRGSTQAVGPSAALLTSPVCQIEANFVFGTYFDVPCGVYLACRQFRCRTLGRPGFASLAGLFLFLFLLSSLRLVKARGIFNQP